MTSNSFTRFHLFKIAESPGAYLLAQKLGEEEFWVPRSLCQSIVHFKTHATGFEEVIVYIADWKAEELGLI